MCHGGSAIRSRADPGRGRPRARRAFRGDRPSGGTQVTLPGPQRDLRQRRGQPGGLQVVQQHHIAGPDADSRLHRVRGKHLCVADIQELRRYY